VVSEMAVEVMATVRGGICSDGGEGGGGSSSRRDGGS
jgi:hypothetical protein